MWRWWQYGVTALDVVVCFLAALAHNILYKLQYAYMLRIIIFIEPIHMIHYISIMKIVYMRVIPCSFPIITTLGKHHSTLVL